MDCIILRWENFYECLKEIFLTPYPPLGYEIRNALLISTSLRNCPFRIIYEWKNRHRREIKVFPRPAKKFVLVWYNGTLWIISFYGAVFPSAYVNTLCPWPQSLQWPERVSGNRRRPLASLDGKRYLSSRNDLPLFFSCQIPPASHLMTFLNEDRDGSPRRHEDTKLKNLKISCLRVFVA